jgi:ribonuclease T2
MNNKAIIRVVLILLVAGIGAWQLRNSPTAPEPAKKSAQQHSGPRTSQHAGAVGEFDYYLVSLSWSPAYCVAHPQDKRQCGDRGFGFVLHGLWPQKSSGGYPENCPANSRPSAATVQKTLAFMPSERLINHEWSKHGTCTGLSADEYFALADRAFSALRVPSGFQAPSTSRQLSVEKILGEFTAANPALPASSLTLRCSGGELEEVRVCVDLQLKPRSCGAGVRTQCGRDSVQIRAVR